MLRPVLLVTVLLASVALSAPPRKRRLTAVEGSASPSLPSPSRFEVMPDTVLHHIASHLETPADLACLAQTCRAELARLRPLLRNLAPVLNTRLPDSGLPQRIRDFIRKCQDNYELRSLVTPQIAVILYDRLVAYRAEYDRADKMPEAEIHDLIRLMAVNLHPVVYGAYLWACQWEHRLQDAEIFRHVMLPSLNLPLPQQIVDDARQVIANRENEEQFDHQFAACIQDVQKRYGAPLARLFPHGEWIMEMLTDHFSIQDNPYATVLGRADVVLALLLRGVRFFGFAIQIIKAATIADLCRLYPLMLPNVGSDEFVLTRCVETPLPNTFQRFLRIPNVVRRLRDDARAYEEWRMDSSPQRDPKMTCAISNLSRLIANRGDSRFVQILVNLHLITDFAPYLLKFCFKSERQEWIRFILQRPEVRQNRDRRSYADAICNFIKHQKPDRTQFVEFVKTEPFSAQYDTEMRLKMLAAMASTGNLQFFMNLLSDRQLLRELTVNETVLSEIFSKAVKAQQNSFLHFILHSWSPFYGLILCKDTLIMNSLFTCISKYPSSATGFLESVTKLPSFSAIAAGSDSSGRTLLHAAFEVANLGMVELLVASPAVNVFATDKHGNGPFYHYLSGFAKKKHSNRAIWLLLLEKLPMQNPHFKPLLVHDIQSAFILLRNQNCFQEFGKLLQEILSTHSFMDGIINVRGAHSDRGTLLYYALRDQNPEAIRCLLKVPELDLLSPNVTPECLSMLLSFKESRQDFFKTYHGRESTNPKP